jgi:hypothetical protein
MQGVVMVVGLIITGVATFREYYIGGHHVIKKWLSYREAEILGRALKPEEAHEVTNIARRLVAIVLLQPALDENYRSVKAATYGWPTQAN